MMRPRSLTRPVATGALAVALGLGALQGVPGASATDVPDPSETPSAGASPSAEPSADPSTDPSAEPTDSPSSAPAPAARPKGKNKKRQIYVPSEGPLFNSPYFKGGGTINNKIYKTIRNTPKGETIKILVWNIDQGPIVNALLNAKSRGVTVQVITAGSTDNANWYRLARGLNAGKGGSFGKRCRGACRSYGPTTHSKVIMVSRIAKQEDIVMVGSFNLTYAAATNQWNDLLTRYDSALYKRLGAVFAQSRKDKPVKRPYIQTSTGNNTQITVFPASGKNPVRALFDPVKCTGVADGYGNNGRTVIRIAIAGWFQAYGDHVAQRVRALWDQGCDVRIVTTLAGGGINQRLKSTRGRGPVPIKMLSVDPNGDGVPNQYLHMKAVSINGAYGNDNSAAIAYTGSHNWSDESRRADEINFRFIDSKGLMLKYQAQINTLFNAKKARYYRELTPSQRQALQDYDNPNSGYELN